MVSARPDSPGPEVSKTISFMGAAMLIANLVGIPLGIIAGWWNLSWAGVSALALTVVAIGLLIGSLRGRGHSLIGPGITTDTPTPVP